MPASRYDLPTARPAGTTVIGLSATERQTSTCLDQRSRPRMYLLKPAGSSRNRPRTERTRAGSAIGVDLVLQVLPGVAGLGLGRLGLDGPLAHLEGRLLLVLATFLQETG